MDWHTEAAQGESSSSYSDLPNRDSAAPGIGQGLSDGLAAADLHCPEIIAGRQSRERLLSCIRYSDEKEQQKYRSWKRADGYFRNFGGGHNNLSFMGTLSSAKVSTGHPWTQKFA